MRFGGRGGGEKGGEPNGVRFLSWAIEKMVGSAGPSRTKRRGAKGRDSLELPGEESLWRTNDCYPVWTAVPTG